MKQILFFTLMLMTVMAVAEKQPFSRYETILTRQMFGPVPDDFDPTVSPDKVARSSSNSAAQKELTKEQEKLQSSIVFSVINVTPEGDTAVGFTDNSDPKAPKHYYLKVGEVKDGWLVKEADAAETSMTIVKDDIEVSLKIGDNSAKGGGATSRAGRGAAERRPMSGLLSSGGGSLRSRRLQRRQLEEAAAEEKRAAAAQERAEREAKAEQEKAVRDAEREEQRQQLMAIQEELRKAREEREKTPEKSSEDAGEKNENNDAQ